MSKNYELAYRDHLKGLKTKEIADKYGVKPATVRSWRNREWKRLTEDKVLQCSTENVATDAVKKARGGQPGNHNAIGNRGNPQPLNTNNFKHGLRINLEKRFPEIQALSEELKHLTGTEKMERILLNDIIRYSTYVQYYEELKYSKLEGPGEVTPYGAARIESQVKGKEISTQYISNIDMGFRYDEMIIKYERLKQKSLDMYIDLGFNREKLDLEKAKFNLLSDSEGNSNKKSYAEVVEEAYKRRVQQ